MANRTQALVLGFFLLVWAGLVAILVAAPAVYDQTLKVPHGDRRPAELAFLAALSAFIALLGVGVLRRWRWTFWLIVVAFLFGLLRVPASLLELTGALPVAGPTWYVLVQGSSACSSSPSGWPCWPVTGAPACGARSETAS